MSIPIPLTARRVPLLLWGPVVTVGLMILGWTLFVNNFGNMFWPKNWGVVEEGRIYRSGAIHERIVTRTLAANGVKVIVVLEGPDPNCPKQSARKRAAQELGIELHRFPMGGDGIPHETAPKAAARKYAAAIAAIVHARRQGKRVLVQCAAGAQRTGGVVACYRMLIEGRSGRFAQDEMRRYGWEPEENRILSDWLRVNMGDIAEALVEMKVIDAVPDPLPSLGQ